MMTGAGMAEIGVKLRVEIWGITCGASGPFNNLVVGCAFRSIGNRVDTGIRSFLNIVAEGRKLVACIGHLKV